MLSLLARDAKYSKKRRRQSFAQNAKGDGASENTRTGRDNDPLLLAHLYFFAKVGAASRILRKLKVPGRRMDAFDR
jgi:hypothetical protein